jgi:KUP system potassium uptake protein
VVFGDIGTNPLFAMRDTFEGPGHYLAVVEDNVLGLLSLMFWSLVLVICVKHLFALMSRNATHAATYFDLPPEQTVEVGLAVEL